MDGAPPATTLRKPLSGALAWAARAAFFVTACACGFVVGGLLGFFLEGVLVEAHPHGFGGLGGILVGGPAGLLLSSSFAVAVIIRREPRQLWRLALALLGTTVLLYFAGVVAAVAFGDL